MMMIRSKWMVVILIVAMIASGTALPGAAVAAEAAAFIIKASSTSVSQGSSVTFTISGTNVQALYAYEAKLRFDSDRLQYVSAESAIGGVTVSKVNGNLMTLAVTKKGDSAPSTGDFDLGAITFVAKTDAVGAAAITLQTIKALDSQLIETHFSVAATATVFLPDPQSPTSTPALTPTPTSAPTAEPGATPTSVTGEEAARKAEELSKLRETLTAAKDDAELAAAIGAVSNAAGDVFGALTKVSDSAAKTKLLEETRATVHAAVAAASGLRDDREIVNAGKAFSDMIGKAAAAASGSTVVQDSVALAELVSSVVAGTQTLVEHADSIETAVEIVQSVVHTAVTAAENTQQSGVASRNIEKQIVKVVNKVVEKAGKHEAAAAVSGHSATVSAADIDLQDMRDKAERAVAAVETFRWQLNDNGLATAIEKKVTIDVAADGNVTEVITELSTDLLALVGEAGIDNIELASGVARVSVPLNAIDATDAASVSIHVKQADKDADLTEAQQAAAGDNPVFEFNASVAKANGDTEKISEFNGRIGIEVPYDAGGGNPETVTVFFINDKGELENKAGRYDPVARTVYFETDHFSKYVAKTNIVTFDDVASSHWAAAYIEVLAAKGFINGKDKGQVYKLGDQVTRAEVAKLVTTALGLVDSNAEAAFSDVDASDWSYAYIASAAKAGIVTGKPDGTFEPDAPISRQDMAVMASRAIHSADISNIDAFLPFADKDEISGYAKEAIARTVMYGILSGKPDNRMDPAGTATRAEAAKIIYNLYNH